MRNARQRCLVAGALAATLLARSAGARADEPERTIPIDWDTVLAPSTVDPQLAPLPADPAASPPPATGPVLRPAEPSPTGAPYRFHPMHVSEQGAYVSFDTEVDLFRRLPSMRFDSIDTPLRTITGRSLPEPRDVQMLRFSVDSGVVLSRPVYLPLLGVGLSGAILSSPRVVTSADGSVIDEHPWTAVQVDFLLPGVGLRLKTARWMFETSARTLVSYTTMRVAAAAGADSVDGDAHAFSFGTRLEAAACRRLDPLERACLVAGVRSYDYAIFAGGFVGLRWELGQ